MSAGLDARRLIDKGFCSDVYAWEPGRVLKLYHAGTAFAKVEREFAITRAVHAAGLPAPAAHDVIDLEGRPGVVLEHINGASMFRRVQAKPWTMFQAVGEMVDLQAAMHRAPAPPELPSQREWFASRIDASTRLSETEKSLAHQRAKELPDGTATCHGDIHPANILFAERGPVIIDWSCAWRGDPLGDVACTSRLLQHADLPPWAPRYTHWLLKLSRNVLHRAYVDRALRLHGATREQLERWEAVLTFR